MVIPKQPFPPILIIGNTLSAYALAEALYNKIPNKIVLLYTKKFQGLAANRYHYRINIPDLEQAIYDWLKIQCQFFLFAPTRDRCLEQFTNNTPPNLQLPNGYALLNEMLCKFKQFQIAKEKNIAVPFQCLFDPNSANPGKNYAIKLRRRQYNYMDQWRFKPLNDTIWQQAKKLNPNEKAQLLLTEIIPNNGHIHTVQGVVHNGKVSIAFTAKKRFSSPNPTGIFVEVVTTNNPALIEISKKLFEDFKATFIFELEFAENEYSSNYFLLDINFKPTLWTSLANKCSVPIAMVFYNCISGNSYQHKTGNIYPYTSLVNTRAWLTEYIATRKPKLSTLNADKRFFLFANRHDWKALFLDIYWGLRDGLSKRRQRYKVN